MIRSTTPAERHIKRLDDAYQGGLTMEEQDP
jgi:hypothetical protein